MSDRYRLIQASTPTRPEIPTNYRNAIVTGDARELAKALPDASVDLIFTDPPYLRDFLPLYGWLATEAARVLKPGGFVLAYAGNVWKAEIMRYFADVPGLTYFWDFVAMHSGMGAIVWNRRVVARHKSILSFVKGEGRPRCNVLGVWTGSGADKRYHTWGQDESTARYYIDCFSAVGDIVLDPFCGGGTTPAMARLLDRQYLAFELDPAMAEKARVRLATVQPLLFPPELGQERLAL